MLPIQLSDPQRVSMGNDWFELADPNHFWIQWRFRVLRRMIGSHLKPETRILEIGCGNGLVMWQMENILKIVPDGCDLNFKALESMMPVNGNVFLYDIFELNQKLVGQYDLVIMMDVLEHIENDLSFLITSLNYLKPGGWIVIGSPAHQRLYSVYDRVVGHVRRYEKKDFVRLFESTGLQNPQICYWGMLMLPMLWLRKKYIRLIEEDKVIRSGFKPPNAFINRLMLVLMKAETRLFPTVPAGISLIAAGQKMY
jgi:SAM-dependent methyltransferase